MKKFLSFVMASAILASSVGMVAYAEEEPENLVRAEITVTLGRNGDYVNTTERDPYELPSSRDEFDAKAVIDMDEVAAEWNKYVKAALDFLALEDNEENRAIVLGYVDVTSSEFVVNIEAEERISNTSPKFSWSSKTIEIFEQVGEPVINDDGNSYTVTMKVKDDVTSVQLDEFFNAEEREVLSLEIKENTISKSGTYEITSTFSGTIGIGLVGGGADKAKVFTIGKKIKDGVYGETDIDYIKRKKSSTGGSSGTSSGVDMIPTAAPTTDPTAAPMPNEKAISDDVEPQLGGTTAGAKLNYKDHNAYIIGYDNGDGTSVVRPENNITRAEVATIFYRILDDESRAKFETVENSFTDVAGTDWFNSEVSTAAAAGIVNGYEDGTFLPDRPITRAEFATIAARFTSLVYEGENMFNDTEVHWAAQAINNAAITGWIAGYEDGSFRPDAQITRAEAITMVNRMLYRFVRTENLHEDMIEWSDNTTDKWYYEAVQEATNSHDYNRRGIGYYEAHTSVN